MDNLQLEHILRIADTIENNGGWRIAAIHIRALVEEYRELRDSPQKADHFYEPIDEVARDKTLRVIANMVPQPRTVPKCIICDDTGSLPGGSGPSCDGICRDCDAAESVAYAWEAV